MQNNFSRKINAIFPQRSINVAAVKYLIYTVLLFFAFSTIILVYLFTVTVGEYNQVLKQKNEDRLKLNYWEKVLSDRPAYPAAYFEAAIYSAKLNQPQKAVEYLNKVLILDPNFQEAEDFVNKLSNR